MNELWTFLCPLYRWAYEWQALIGSLVALAAAWRTIHVMRTQIDAEASRHQDARKRKRLAARARIPDALSEIGLYVRGSSARLVGETEALPTEPVSAISDLKEVIEFIDDGAAKRTFELVSWYQVFRARNRHAAPKLAGPELDERLYDATLFQAYINSLFDYGRNESDEVATEKPSFEEMDSASKNAFGLRHMIQQPEMYEGVKTIIARRHSGK